MTSLASAARNSPTPIAAAVAAVVVVVVVAATAAEDVDDAFAGNGGGKVGVAWDVAGGGKGLPRRAFGVEDVEQIGGKKVNLTVGLFLGRVEGNGVREQHSDI